MGRKETPTPTPPANQFDNPVALAQASDTLNQAAKLKDIQRDYEHGRDVINQVLGQVQAAGAFEEFSRTVRISKLAIVKDSKAYKYLKGQISPHGAEFSGTWEEFCGLLGRSVDQVDRDIANLQAFGEEALDQMQRLGVGYRDLRQFRKLPNDQIQALAEVAKTGDKEAFLELAEDLIAKHSREKEATEKALEEAQATLAAKDEVLGDMQQKMVKLQTQTKRIATKGPDEALIELSKEASALCTDALGLLRGNVRLALAAMRDHQEQHGGDLTVQMAGLVGQLQAQLAELRSEFDLPDVSDAADKQLAQEVAQWAKVN
jgi:hypothetical protein